MKTRTFVGLLVCATLLFCLYVTPIAQSEPPGFAALFDDLEWATGINSRGDIVGWGGDYAFLIPDGDVTKMEQIEIEGANLTRLTDINDQGDMVGSYRVWDDGLGMNIWVGFVLSAKGELTELHWGEGLFVQANGINDEGVVVGAYCIPSGACNAFRWWKGELTPMDNYPGAAETIPNDINNKGDVVGYYRLALGFPPPPTYSYFMSSSGDFTTIDDPAWNQSQAASINARGDIVGRVVLHDGSRKCYLLRDGVLTTFNYPDPNAIGSIALGINKQGDIVGNTVIAEVSPPPPFNRYGFLLSGPGMRIK